jgi:hypothetical protein
MAHILGMVSNNVIIRILIKIKAHHNPEGEVRQVKPVIKLLETMRFLA